MVPTRRGSWKDISRRVHDESADFAVRNHAAVGAEPEQQELPGPDR